MIWDRRSVWDAQWLSTCRGQDTRTRPVPEALQAAWWRLCVLRCESHPGRSASPPPASPRPPDDKQLTHDDLNRVSSKHSQTHFGFYFEKPYKRLWARVSEAATFWPFGRTRRRTRGRRAGRWRRNTPRWTEWTSESSSADCRTSAAFDRETSGNLQEEEDEEDEFINRSHSQGLKFILHRALIRNDMTDCLFL